MPLLPRRALPADQHIARREQAQHRLGVVALSTLIAFRASSVADSRRRRLIDQQLIFHSFAQAFSIENAARRPASYLRARIQQLFGNRSQAAPFSSALSAFLGGRGRVSICAR